MAWRMRGDVRFLRRSHDQTNFPARVRQCKCRSGRDNLDVDSAKPQAASERLRVSHPAMRRDGIDTG